MHEPDLKIDDRMLTSYLKQRVSRTAFLSDVPPNNRAFETDIVYYLRDAVAIFQQRGFLGGSGQAVTYPGRDVALATAGAVGAAVTDKTP